MRFAGFAAIVLSVVFGAGGVTYTAADETAPAGSGERVGAQQCTPSAAPRTREVAVNALTPALQGAERVVVLDTRGYNYRRPGEPLPSPARRPPSSSK